jgi:hypothetical protein
MHEQTQKHGKEHVQRGLQRGAKGGLYFVGSNGKRVYVGKS